MSADNGTAAVVEGNWVFHCAGGGPYHDTWQTRDLLVSGNYYSDVVMGPFQNLSGVSPARALKSLTRAYDSAAGKWKVTATIADTFTHHGFEKDEIVRITEAAHAGYNGNMKVLAPGADTKKFEYYIDNDPGGDESTTAAKYQRIFQFGRLTIENNVIELSLRKLHRFNEWGRSIGIAIYVGNFPPQNIGRQLIIRNNLIRQINNISDPATLMKSRAMEIFGTPDSGVENVLIEKNLIRLDNVANTGLGRPLPIELARAGATTFDNRSPDGKLLRVFDLATASELQDTINRIEAAIDETLLTSLVRRECKE